MRGKVCLVTGATSGIGAETAKQLAQRGATVIVVGRSPKKSAATVAQIKRQTGNASVEYLLADLSSQKEIRVLAQQFKSKYARLDVLVNNAGGIWMTRQESVDGIEMTLAVNHLSYFMLANLLLDTLMASAPARIVNVSSSFQWLSFNSLDDLQSRHGLYIGLNAYNQIQVGERSVHLRNGAAIGRHRGYGQRAASGRSQDEALRTQPTVPVDPQSFLLSDRGERQGRRADVRLSSDLPGSRGRDRQVFCMEQAATFRARVLRPGGAKAFMAIERGDDGDGGRVKDEDRLRINSG